MPKSAHVLVAPLDWGLGHASRSMPLIQGLLDKGTHVILAGSDDSLRLLTDAFPQLPYLELPPYAVKYSAGRSQIGKIALQIPRLLKTIASEHRLLQEWINAYSLAGVISDNRYGLWNDQIPSIFVCHQLAIRVPAVFMPFRRVLYQLHLRYINRFSACWIPDFEEAPHLSGDLSNRFSLPEHTSYIGPLSRFQQKTTPIPRFSYAELNQIELDIVAILSGPEPQRSLLEEAIIAQAKQQKRPVWIVQGKPNRTTVVQQDHITLIPYMQMDDLALVFEKASLIISRSGYSSLMDYASIGLPQCILIPTPGQTEQEYLAELMAQQKRAVVSKQSQFELAQCLKQLPSTSGFAKENSSAPQPSHWNVALDRFLQML